ncbi:MAG: uroporphyrinogen-III C-methyltransferase [Lautropia sp.]
MNAPLPKHVLPSQALPGPEFPGVGLPGRVVLVGAGPGDVELLTLKAARLIGAADWLVHDALVHPDVLALASRATRIAVGKRAGRRSTSQAEINRILIDCARRGGLVIRLKGGDPLLFARAREELDAVRAAGVAVAVVPGITTAQAAHAALAVPMTERGRRRSIVFATPQVNAAERAAAAVDPAAPIDLQWARALVNAGGGAVYMAATAAARVRASLLALGMAADTPATWLIDVSLPTQTVIPTSVGRLQALPPGIAGRPALLLLGTAVDAPWGPPGRGPERTANDTADVPAIVPAALAG